MTRIGLAAAMAAVLLVPAFVLPACDKKDDAPNGAAPGAQAAPSGSGPDGRRDREHEGDGGHDREHPPR
jgi:hypothetical protein